MDVETIILSVVNLRQILYITYMQNLKKKRYKQTYLQNKNRLTNRKLTYGYQKGKLGEGER